MKIKIEVKDEDEAVAIRRALDDEMTRALVITVGVLLGLDTDRARARVLNFLADKIAEEQERP